MDIRHWGPGPRSTPLPYSWDPAPAGPVTPNSWAYFVQCVGWDTWAVLHTPAWQCLPLWPRGWRWERLIGSVWWPLSWSHNSSRRSLFSCQESESGALHPVFSLILTVTLGGRHHYDPQFQKVGEETGLESLGATAMTGEVGSWGVYLGTPLCLALAACLLWRRLWSLEICPWSPECLDRPGFIQP